MVATGHETTTKSTTWPPWRARRRIRLGSTPICPTSAAAKSY